MSVLPKIGWFYLPSSTWFRNPLSTLRGIGGRGNETAGGLGSGKLRAIFSLIEAQVPFTPSLPAKTSQLQLCFAAQLMHCRYSMLCVLQRRRLPAALAALAS